MLRRDYTGLPADYSCPPATLSFGGSAHFDFAGLRASGHDGFFLRSGSGMEGSRGKKETAGNMESLPPALLQLTGDVLSRLPAVCIPTVEGSDGEEGLRSNG